MAWPSNSIFNLETSSEYLGHGSVSRSWVQSQGHSDSKTTGRKSLGLDRNICYDNAQSNSERLTFWPRDIFLYFYSIQALSFACLKLAASFSVWGYIFTIFRSPSRFKVIGVNLKVTKQRQHTGLCSPRTQFNSPLSQIRVGQHYYDTCIV